MLASEEVVAFVPTRDPARARDFYETKLGLDLVSEDGFALVFDANGTDIRVVNVASVENFAPAPFTVLGWHVSDIEAVVRKLNAAGVEMQRYEGMDQDTLRIWASPSGARVAWFLDPDRNVLSVSQY
jgi:catechol 2,3-dioxygenase-like lactoylglutathione lyase family enzyme